ncbi:hypothetical protein HMPREF9205_0020 [Cutibacterium acnes SK182]|nr:hypothetical protein HMPREF9205_0020 [Cutibacterium acnes SK182]
MKSDFHSSTRDFGPQFLAIGAKDLAESGQSKLQPMKS